MFSADTRKRTRIKAIFHAIDQDDSGTIDVNEVQVALSHLGANLNRTTARELIERYDQDGDGSLDFEEFAALFDRVRLEEIFDHIDTDHSGTIEIGELKQLFAEFGVELGRMQVDNIIKHLDKDKDEIITKNEFFDAFQHIPDLNIETLGRELLSLSTLDSGSEIAPSLPVPDQSLFQFLFAGGAGGMASKTVTAPLERVKIVAQVSKSKATTSEIVKNIIKEEGWRGLFKGNMAGILRVVPFSALVCFSYTIMVGLLPKDKKYDKIEPLWRFVSGGVAGGFASCCTYPLDVMRARLATKKELTMRVATQEIFRGGFRSCFRGIRPTLLAIAPFIAVQQSSYDVLKSSLLNYYLPSVPLFLGCGVVAGIAAQAVTHPFDVIRRQMQTREQPTVTSLKLTTWNEMKSIVKREGTRGLFRGIIPATLKVAPAVAISLLVRDACLNRLTNK